ncbi:MAG: DUF3597 domain-containing protein [Xanthobacteraceae bacterium]
MLELLQRQMVSRAFAAGSDEAGFWRVSRSERFAPSWSELFSEHRVNSLNVLSEEKSMSIFGTIMSAIFRHGSGSQPSQASPGAGRTSAAPPSGSTSPQSAPTPAQSGAGAAPSGSTATQGSVDVEAVLNGLASQKKQKLDWRHSIVDLMKLLDLESSLAARKQLAQELHYSGNPDDSAAMNIWLHKQVMIKLAENGGKVPENLRRVA